MTTFHEVLEPAKSTRHRGIRWTPDDGSPAGALRIDTDRSTASYAVEEFPCGWDGRSFRLAKLDASSDPEADGYEVFCARNGQDHRCCCKGFERTGDCKHLAAALALIENGWV